MEAYIDSISAISPQNSFEGDQFLKEIVEYSSARYLKCIEPHYSDLIDPMAARRMSRIIKMGVASALKCLNNAGIKDPEAIICGTGLGCTEDTEKFLGSIYSSEEKLLNPTPFIQSTHNTVAATIALLLKCNSYNNTFSHRGFSFENALLDSLMLLQEDHAKNVLIGGFDELTPSSFNITDRLRFWKKEPVDNLRLLEYNTRGSMAGEGSAFFFLSKLQTGTSFAKVVAVETFYKPEGFSETEMKVSDFIIRNIEHFGKSDLVLMGFSGDEITDRIYYQLKDILFRHNPCAYYKHLCGEYDTSSSFALFLASAMLKQQYIPSVIRLDDKPVREIRNILIYNHLRNNYHSMILISSC